MSTDEFTKLSKQMSKMEAGASKASELLNAKIDQVSEKLHTRIDLVIESMATKDELTRMFIYMEKRFDDVDNRLDSTASEAEMHKVLNWMDSMEKQVETDTQERLVMGHILDRHGRWIHEIAGKADHQLVV